MASDNRRDELIASKILIFLELAGLGRSTWLVERLLSLGEAAVSLAFEFLN